MVHLYVVGRQVETQACKFIGISICNSMDPQPSVVSQSTLQTVTILPMSNPLPELKTPHPHCNAGSFQTDIPNILV